jgi:hypothetical protein
MDNVDLLPGQCWRRKRDGQKVIIVRVDISDVRVHIGWSTGDGRTRLCGMSTFFRRYEYITPIAPTE